MDLIRDYLQEQSAIDRWTTHPLKSHLQWQHPTAEFIQSIAPPSELLEQHQRIGSAKAQETMRDFFKHNKDLKKTLTDTLKSHSYLTLLGQEMTERQLANITTKLEMIIDNTDDITVLIKQAPEVIKKLLPSSSHDEIMALTQAVHQLLQHVEVGKSEHKESESERVGITELKELIDNDFIVEGREISRTHFSRMLSSWSRLSFERNLSKKYLVSIYNFLYDSNITIRTKKTIDKLSDEIANALQLYDPNASSAIDPTPRTDPSVSSAFIDKDKGRFQ